MKKPNHKPVLPKRLCLDPHTKYCIGRYGHRGCCDCSEYNAGTDWAGGCRPYLLTDYGIEQGWLKDDGTFVDEDLND